MASGIAAGHHYCRTNFLSMKTLQVSLCNAVSPLRKEEHTSESEKSKLKRKEIFFATLEIYFVKYPFYK